MVKAMAWRYWLNGCARLSANSFCTPPDLLAHKMLTFQWQMVPDEGIEPPTNHYEWSVMPFN